jgi:tetratricopeptide (TPR) repeat protein
MKRAKGERKSPTRKCLIVAILSSQVAIFLSACAIFQVGGDVQKGRMELLYGDPKVALAHFQRAAETDPDYRLHYSIFPEGVWTYVGRAHYAAGEMPQARRALERARREHPEDNLARLYLGLVLFQDGDRERGLREIEAALKGVIDWFDYVEFYHLDGPYWDPGKYLRKAIQEQLAALRGSDVNVQNLPQSVASLGREIEIEIDRAKDHKMRDWMRRDDDRRSGARVGFGLGF